MTEPPPPRASFRTQLILLSSVVAGMLLLSFAAVPLYRIFCQVTGFAGTPQRKEASAASSVLARKLNVFFTADVNPALPWRFHPLQKDVTFPIGETQLVFFEAENTSNTPITGMATFNVTPEIAGQYFVKVKCFCFDKMTLQPHQKITLPVTFYVDPAIITHPQLADLTNMTLSYTFFDVNSRD